MTPRSMDKTASRVSDERLAEMLSGLDGVTPGPRHIYVSPTDILVTDDAGNNVAHFLPMGDDSQADFVNATAFARCDPETMRSILTELQSLRSSDGVSDGSKGVIEAARWLDEYLSELRKTPTRYADDIEGLERVAAALSALDSGTGGQQPVAEYDPDAPPDHSADNAADFIFKHLSDALEVNGKWSVSDGTETWDGDVVGTLYNILKAAGIWDEETNELTEPKAGVVSEAMVERACGHLASWGDAEIEWFDHRDDIRAALTAALNGEKP